MCPFRNNQYFKKIFTQVINNTDYDFSKIEFIIIDNNTDALLQQDLIDFLSPYTNQYTIKQYQNRNIGQLANASNKAIELADSKWFVYLCATNTYIFQPDWLKHMTIHLSDIDYANGYVMAGTIAQWPNYIPNPSMHIHIQGGLFIARTEYMKHNNYTMQYPFSFMDVIHSANALAQGKKLKSISEVWSSMATVNASGMDFMKKAGQFKIIHAHGCEHYGG